MNTAIVTGASRGIGLGIVKELLSSGWYVVASARKSSTEIDTLIKKEPNKICFVACDISNNADRENLVAQATKKHGTLDLVVNNAGVASATRKDMLELTEKDFDNVMDINLKGTFFMAQAAAKVMLAQGFGRIINISSISSYTASIDRAEYCISKAGISMITKLYCARLAEGGIGVFEIMPGIIETAMTAPAKKKYEKLIAEGITPIQRLGTPSDIADVVGAIASGIMDYCTGTVISVDGGFGVRRL